MTECLNSLGKLAVSHWTFGMLGHIFWRKMFFVFCFFYPSVHNSFVRSVPLFLKLSAILTSPECFQGWFELHSTFPPFTPTTSHRCGNFSPWDAAASLRFQVWNLADLFDQKHFQSVLVGRNHTASFWLWQKPETTEASCRQKLKRRTKKKQLRV